MGVSVPDCSEKKLWFMDYTHVCNLWHHVHKRAIVTGPSHTLDLFSGINYLILSGSSFLWKLSKSNWRHCSLHNHTVSSFLAMFSVLAIYCCCAMSNVYWNVLSISQYIIIIVIKSFLTCPTGVMWIVNFMRSSWGNIQQFAGNKLVFVISARMALSWQAKFYFATLKLSSPPDLP